MSLLDPHMLIHLIVRGLDFATMVIVVGGLAFESFVAAPALDRLEGLARESAALAFRRRYARFVGWSLVALLVLQGIDLVLRVQMMSGRPFSAVPGLLPQAAVGTHVGKVWLGKMAVLVGLLIVWRVASGTDAPPRPRPTRSRYVLLAGAALFCLMVALAGHGADQGNLSLAVAGDWLHVAAVSTWVGGLISLRALMPETLNELDEETAARLFADTMARFSTMAGWALVLLLSTGVYNTLIHIHAWAGLGSPYGLALLAKVGFVTPMIALGAWSRYRILPELQGVRGEREGLRGVARLVDAAIALGRRLPGWRVPRALGDTVAARHQTCLHLIFYECLLAAGVLVCTAILTQTTPPHVTGFHAPGSTPPEMRHMREMPGQNLSRHVGNNDLNPPVITSR